MAAERVERRLAAIFAGDVVGYSRLMGVDEEHTLSQLNAHRREFLEPKIAEHRGRIVKRTGDGILIEFASAVDAVRCAVEIQRGMTERNAPVPQEKRIEFRIGIHVGDIIIEDGDMFGDGVNIASRLEGIAQPGDICISDDAYRQVRGKLDANFQDAGEYELKNIARPVRVYQLQTGGGGVRRAPTLALPDKPSIAVLPFQNLSGDPEQDYFADGMVEDIITGLSHIKWMFVIARNSTFVYKGQSIDVKKVGRELGVRYVLEGSVRKAGDRVRITGQLIDASTGAHVWAERYDRRLEDIFALQDEITLNVVGAIEPTLRQAEIERVKRERPDNSYALCQMFMWPCRMKLAKHWNCSTVHSRSSRTMHWPMPTPHGVTKFGSYGRVKGQRIMMTRSGMLMQQLPMAPMMQQHWHWRVSSSLSLRTTCRRRVRPSTRHSPLVHLRSLRLPSAGLQSRGRAMRSVP
jgi:adenylate cyclase